MTGNTAVVRFLLIVWIFAPGFVSDVTCINDNGEPVDWYILYKFPKAIGDGVKYLYMDESTNGWRYSSMKINESGALKNTLQPLLDSYDAQTKHFGYMLYNDQPPDQNDAPPSFGHSKGVVMLDRQSGVWISHSTPHFPTYRNRNFWPESGNVNAQTFLCVTFPYDLFIDIGVQLIYINAYSFDSHIPPTFHKVLQYVAQPKYKEVMLQSKEGHNFHSFAKSGRFGDDLYSGLILTHVEQDLFVKSWGNPGSSKLLPSNCSIPHHVFHVTEVKFPSGEDFSDTVDHSKWCVTEDEAFTCIADMNREESQKGRGGGAICTDNLVVWKAFHGLFDTYERCKELENY